MSNFVYDGTGLPTGKTDVRPLTGLPSQNITAAEWNSLMQAVADLRAAVLNGDYQGLATAAAAVSAAGSARLRYSGGELQASLNGGAYERLSPQSGFINAHDIGIKPSNTGAQNLAAWELYQHSFTPPYNGNIILFPQGIYQFSDTFVVRHSYRIVGTGGWDALNSSLAPTTFQFGLGVTGVRFETYSLPWAASTVYALAARVYTGTSTYECITPGTSASSGLGPSGQTANITDGTAHWKYLSEGAYDRADYSSLEDILLYGGNGGNIALVGTEIGIEMKVRASLTRVGVRNFRGNGVNIAAGVEGSTNANGWVMNTVRVTGCGSHGVYIKGGDANAGVSTSLDVDTVGGYGIYEDSFLGNTHVGPQIAFASLGAVYARNSSARNVFLGLYSEGGQPPSIIDAPSMVLGGLQGAGLKGTALYLINDNIGNARAYGNTDLLWYPSTAYPGSSGKLYNQNNGNIYRCSVGGISAASGTGPSGTGSAITDGTVTWAYSSTAQGRVRVSLGGNGTNDVDNTFVLDVSRETAVFVGDYGQEMQMVHGADQQGWSKAYGWLYPHGRISTYHSHLQTTFPAKGNKSPPAGSVGLPWGYYIGTVRVDQGDHKPTGYPQDFTFDVGDRTENTVPAPGGYMGWVCTTAGTLRANTGLTATATADGTNVIVLSAAPGNGFFYVGDFITVGGAARRITAISGLSFTLNAAVTAGSGLALDFTQPVLKGYGLIEV